MGNVTVIGSSNIDLVIKSAGLPGPGETVLGGEFFQAYGGKGANQAVAAGRAGARTAFISCVGDDDFGRQMIVNFTRDSIDTAGVEIVSAPSGAALIMVDAEGENSISVAPGANSHVTPDHVRRHSALIEQADIVLVQLEIPLETVYASIEVAHAAGIPVILNPAPAPPEVFSPTHLSRVAYFTPNRGELSTIAGADGNSREEAEAAARTLIAGGIGNVIVTLGGEGALFVNPEVTGYVPAPEVTPIDTVGAGDCFNGCLACALAEGQGLEDALRFAAAGAALSVTRQGAQPSMPMRDEILAGDRDG